MLRLSRRTRCDDCFRRRDCHRHHHLHNQPPTAINHQDANKEEIKRLRDDNKELRVKIAQLQRAKDGVEGASEGDSDALRNGVVKMRKQ